MFSRTSASALRTAARRLQYSEFRHLTKQYKEQLKKRIMFNLQVELFKPVKTAMHHSEHMSTLWVQTGVVTFSSGLHNSELVKSCSLSLPGKRTSRTYSLSGLDTGCSIADNLLQNWTKGLKNLLAFNSCPHLHTQKTRQASSCTLLVTLT